mmetsp:Transcript_35602/g.42877  ORF Transcript_35602/g.42877 Transcript_35602/m.42877 type:complete len:84 (+) Transcript_35602:134-385(+)
MYRAPSFDPLALPFALPLHFPCTPVHDAKLLDAKLETHLTRHVIDWSIGPERQKDVFTPKTTTTMHPTLGPYHRTSSSGTMFF